MYLSRKLICSSYNSIIVDKQEGQQYTYTVSTKKHGNFVTISNLSTSAQLGCKMNVWRGCVPTMPGGGR